jgi:LmbE family N-acetylglucosaminyl deacetylase
MKILAIGTHPDDLEISCAGALTKMKRAGHEVVMCHVCDGDKGHYFIPPAELTLIRRKEAQNAGALIDCEVVALGMKDCEIRADHLDTRKEFIDLFRSVQPDLVITHAPDDYMPDHVEVSKLVFDTSFVASVPNMKTKITTIPKIPALFYMDNLSGINFQPTIYVNIEDTLETKLRMLECHQSQLVWLKEHDDVDILDFVKTLAKMRGIQSGCAYAEGFIQHMVWARPNTIRFPV